jgi:plastocyanin
MNPPQYQSYSQINEKQNRHKKLLHLVVGIIILGVIGFVANYIFHNKDSISLPLIDQPETATTVESDPEPVETPFVSLTSNGFTPNIIKVPIGTLVTWKNDDTSQRQIAFNADTSQALITDFNSDVILQQFDTISYTFQSAGTYYFYDKLDPEFSPNTVIVE